MAVITLWAQAGTYPARHDRQFIEAVFAATERVMAGLVVAPRGAGANISVDVDTGLAVIMGDDQPNQGMYLCANETLINLPMPATPASGTRVDAVVMQVHDVDAGGSAGADLAVIEAVEGPGGATLPTIPPSALLLAHVNRVNTEGSIQAPAIVDMRPLGAYGGGQTVSTVDPSGRGVAGDLWLKVT